MSQRTHNSNRAEGYATNKESQLWQELEDLRENIDFIERKEELFDTLEPNEDTPFGDWV